MTTTTLLRLADEATVPIVLREVSRRTATALTIDGVPAQDFAGSIHSCDEKPDAKQSMMTATDLLTDVISTIVKSGYAELPKQSRYERRIDHVNELAKDCRIDNSAYSPDVLNHVQAVCKCSRRDATYILHRARKKRREAKK